MLEATSEGRYHAWRVWRRGKGDVFSVVIEEPSGIGREGSGVKLVGMGKESKLGVYVDWSFFGSWPATTDVKKETTGTENQTMRVKMYCWR
jgi:hypothetical protein